MEPRSRLTFSLPAKPTNRGRSNSGARDPPDSRSHLHLQYLLPLRTIRSAVWQGVLHRIPQLTKDEGFGMIRAGDIDTGSLHIAPGNSGQVFMFSSPFCGYICAVTVHSLGVSVCYMFILELGNIDFSQLMIYRSKSRSAI